MDWKKCFLCQKAEGSLRGSDDGYKIMAKNLPEFRTVGGAENVDFSVINDGSGILNTLKEHHALYHK